MSIFNADSQEAFEAMLDGAAFFGADVSILDTGDRGVSAAFVAWARRRGLFVRSSDSPHFVGGDRMVYRHYTVTVSGPRRLESTLSVCTPLGSIPWVAAPREVASQL